MEFKGKVIWIGQLRTGVSTKTGQAWTSQDFCVENSYTDGWGEHISRICFNLYGNDKIAEAGLRIGMDVTVGYAINAREYDGKYYNEVRAYKVIPNAKEQPHMTNGGQAAQAYFNPAAAQPQQAMGQSYQGQMYSGQQMPQGNVVPF